MTGGRVILHLDMDAFYASIEQRDDPSLRGKPVIIGADPQEGQGRGVVAAASYEAREHGVHSAMPISRAWRACPQGVYLRPNFQKYALVSDQVFEVVGELVDVLEPASIDEAYADVTETTQGSFRRARRLASELMAQVRGEFELTCSIGIGPNKFVAKVASDLDKPDGLTVVPPEAVEETLGPLGVRVIPGVGPKTSQALETLGIGTVAQLARADPKVLEEHFGVWGPEMVALARGRDERPVTPDWERKSVGAETTFGEDLAPELAGQRLDAVVDEAVERLRDQREQARTITLKVRLEDFETFTRAFTLQAPTDEVDVVREIVHALFDQAPVDRAVRLLGVRLSGLERGGPRQASLADWPADVLGEATLPEPPGSTRWF